MDKISIESRRKNMARIKSKNTMPEIQLRKALYKKGHRYRIHSKNLPGRPDIVFTKYKLAIFVNGCFWHGHDRVDGHIPKTRKIYWKNKIDTNILRDLKNQKELNDSGWSFIVAWECKIEKDLAGQLKIIGELV